jgi:hypothetical protein
MKKVDQAQWYRDWLASETSHGKATLWVIGENWAFENRSNPLVNMDMGISADEVDDDQLVHGVNPMVTGQGSFTFVDGVTVGFGPDVFTLNGGCPVARTYDLIVAAAGVQTHLYKKTPSTSSTSGAVVMNKNTANRFNTIGMGFNWFDIRGLGGSAPAAREDLARKILNAVLPDGCRRVEPPTDLASDEELEALPRVTALHQNVPNPFNPLTTIEFDLAEEGHVTLRIYDISGRMVRALVDDKLPRQRHSILWNATDDRGNPVASGVYLYQLEGEAFTATRKLVVLK